MKIIKFLLIALVTCVGFSSQAGVEINSSKIDNGSVVSLSGDIAESFFNFLPYKTVSVKNCLKTSAPCTNCTTTCLKTGNEVVKLTKSDKGLSCEKNLKEKTNSCKLVTQTGEKNKKDYWWKD